MLMKLPTGNHSHNPLKPNKTIKKIIDKLGVLLLVVILNAMFITTVGLGWVLLQDANIIVNMVGAIMFLTGTGFIIICVVAMILVIFTVLYND